MGCDLFNLFFKKFNFQKTYFFQLFFLPVEIVTKISVAVRHRRNRIWAIKDGSAWINGRKNITKHLISKFQELYQSSHPNIPDDMDGLGQKYITLQENLDLIRIPSEEEIKSCIEKLHLLKSLGPDGFPGVFFRSYWSIVKDMVVW